MYRTIALSGFVFALACGPAYAQDTEEGDTARGAFSFVLENDFFSGTDRNYTNGVRVSYVTPTENQDSLGADIVRTVLGSTEGSQIRLGFASGHSIFTPEETEVRIPPPGDHPYAGFLYGEASIYARSPKRLETLSLQVGLVGPSAQGEWVQNNFHELINSYEVLGWDTQLSDEVTFALTYERRNRAFLESEIVNLEFDVAPSYGFTVGTSLTQANVGAVFRLGQDLANDFGPPRVRPSLGGGSYFEPRDRFAWYGFLGLEGRAVARNIFLDGNTFAESRSVDRRPLVGELQAGIALQLGDTQIAYTFATRTEEYETQNGRQAFGALSFTTRF